MSHKDIVVELGLVEEFRGNVIFRFQPCILRHPVLVKMANNQSVLIYNSCNNPTCQFRFSDILPYPSERGWQLEISGKGEVQLVQRASSYVVNRINCMADTVSVVSNFSAKA